MFASPFAGRRPAVFLIALAAAIAASIVLSGRHSSASAAPTPPPVGIVNAFGPEQAAILAEMKVTHHSQTSAER
jgi:hypothetical protein